MLPLLFTQRGTSREISFPHLSPSREVHGRKDRNVGIVWSEQTRKKPDELIFVPTLKQVP